MEYIEISAKTVNDAITEACQKLGVTSDKLDYSVIEEGSNGFLGIGSRPAVIKARVLEVELSTEDLAKKFLSDVFAAMQLEVVITLDYKEAERELSIDLNGDDMIQRITEREERKLLRTLQRTLLTR